MLFRHHIVEFFPRRTASTSLRLLTASPPSSAAPPALARPGPARVTPVGNRWRPPSGGPHERRIHGTPTCHRPPPRRPPRPADLPGAGPHRGLVPQVVAPLPRLRRRGPVRPDPGTPRRPAHPARVGTGHPLRPPSAAGPCRAGDSLQLNRGDGHPDGTHGAGLPPLAQPAHHRAGPPAQRLDGAAGAPRPAAAAPAVPRPAGPRLQRPP